MHRSETIETSNISLTQLIKAHKTLEDALTQAKSLLEQEGVIQRFKYTFELTWRTLQSCLLSKGIVANNPRDAFHEAAKIGLIQDLSLWLSFLEARNNATNTEKDQQEIVNEIYANISLFSTESLKLTLLLEHKEMTMIEDKEDTPEKFYTYYVQKGKIVVLKVTLTDYLERIKTHPYRILAIPGNLDLYRLAFEIVNSFNFDFDHCFGFYDDFKHYHDSKEAYELFRDLDPEDTEPLGGGTLPKGVGIKVKTAFNEVGKKLRFIFDYGDNWYFEVEVLEIVDPNSKLKYPRVTKKVGRSPEQYAQYF